MLPIDASNDFCRPFLRGTSFQDSVDVVAPWSVSEKGKSIKVIKRAFIIQKQNDYFVFRSCQWSQKLHDILPQYNFFVIVGILVPQNACRIDKNAASLLVHFVTISFIYYFNLYRSYFTKRADCNRTSSAHGRYFLTKSVKGVLAHSQTLNRYV